MRYRFRPYLWSEYPVLSAFYKKGKSEVLLILFPTAGSNARPLETGFDGRPTSPVCESIGGIHYVNGVPYTYQNGTAIFNHQPGSIGFAAGPHIIPIVSRLNSICSYFCSLNRQYLVESLL